VGGGRSRWGRGRGDRLGGRRFARPLHHRRRLLPAQEGQAEGGAHKEDGGYRGEFGQKGGRAGGAEDRLAGAAEGGTDASPLAVLQEHDADQGQGYGHMDDNDDGCHDNFIL
jgi:hypothetical protein